MAVLALITLGLLYLYNNPRIVYQNKPYPVYQTEYIREPRHRGLYADPRGHMPHPGHMPGHMPHPGHVPGHREWIAKGGRNGPNGNPVPGSGGGGI